MKEDNKIEASPAVCLYLIEIFSIFLSISA